MFVCVCVCVFSVPWINIIYLELYLIFVPLEGN